MKIEIVHCGLYNRPETYVQELVFTHVGLVIGGLDYMNIHAQTAGEPFHLATSEPPFLALLPAGMTIDFRFNRRRENWVIQCRTPELRPDPRLHCSRLKTDENSELAKSLNISSIPFVMIVADGKTVYSHTGYTPGSERLLVEKALSFIKK